MQVQSETWLLKLWKCTFFFFLLFLSTAISAQVVVKGSVVDSRGAGVPGVTVTVVATGAGTTTNDAGLYSIRARKGDKIQFTSVGFTTYEAVVGNNTEIDVTLAASSSQLMDEVVVVGYGSQKRSDVTGSIASVPKERLSKLPVNNVL